MENLAAYAGQIATWRDALADDGDLLLYGCDLAGGEDGRTLLEGLRALTGADVAASTDDTGHAVLGGDWELEYARGEIETRCWSPPPRRMPGGTLKTFVVTNTNNSGAGSLRQAILDANALGGTDTISFNIPRHRPESLLLPQQRDRRNAGHPGHDHARRCGHCGFRSGLSGGHRAVLVRITLSGSDLDVTQAVIIDGSTQPGYDAAKGPIIEINAAGVSSRPTPTGSPTTGASTVRGLVINRADEDAIEIDAGAGGSDPSSATTSAPTFRAPGPGESLRRDRSRRPT